jgi:CPA1 family monovalent cation:H+ antiporter
MELPTRDIAGVDAVAMVFAVVFFSLVVQGVTYRPLLDKLGLTSQTDEVTEYERTLAETLALRAAIAELEMMRHGGEISAPLYKEFGDDLAERLGDAERRHADLTTSVSRVRRRQVKMAARRIAAAQKRALSEASRSGRISDVVARNLSRDIDIEVDEEMESRSNVTEPDSSSGS